MKNSGPSASLRRLHDAPHRAARHAWPSEPEFFTLDRQKAMENKGELGRAILPPGVVGSPLWCPHHGGQTA